jgi:hypothetical protein
MRKCFQCQSPEHLYRDCPQKSQRRARLRAVPDLTPDPAPGGDGRGPDGTYTGIGGLLAYYERTAPLSSLAALASRRPDSPAAIAREVRLRAEAARQVRESRLERGAEP